MDKTFNDLMSIVNRTKKIDEKEGRTTRKIVKKEEPKEEILEFEEVIEEPKKKVEKKSSSLFDGADAINKLISKEKSSTAKKTTKKTPAKKEENEEEKKTTTKKNTDKINNLAKNIKNTSKKTPQTNSDIDLSDLKNAQLYEALHSSLFSQGTDISQYLESEEDTEKQNQLETLKKQREAMKISQEISKEQQEYEQLFTGGFMNTDEEMIDEETIEARENLTEDRLSNIANIPESPKPTPRPQPKSSDVDKKIAEYYRRKQEMIDKFNKEQFAESMEEEKQISSYEQRQSEYEDVFNNAIYNSQPTEKVEEKEEVENDVSLEENLENVEEYENAELLQQEEKREMIFEDYDDEEDSNRRVSNYFFPTNSEFEDIDSEYALIKRGSIDDKKVINYNEEDFDFNRKSESIENVVETTEEVANEGKSEVEDVTLKENLENIEETALANEENITNETNDNLIEEITEESTSENIEENIEDVEESLSENEELVEENIIPEANEEYTQENEIINKDIVDSNYNNINNEENVDILNSEEVEYIEESSQEDNTLVDNNDSLTEYSNETFENDELSNEEALEEISNIEEVKEDYTEEIKSNSLEINNENDEEIITNEKDNEYDNSIIEEYSEVEKDKNYNLENGDASDYIIASNMPEEDRITSETSVFAEEVVYEEDNQFENELTTQEVNEETPAISESNNINNEVVEDIDNEESVEEITESVASDYDTVENITTEESQSNDNKESEIQEEIVNKETSEEQTYENITSEEDQQTEVITTEDVNDKLYDAHLNDEEEEDYNQSFNNYSYDEEDDDNTMVIDGDRFVSELSLYPEMTTEESVEESQIVEDNVDNKIEEVVEEDKEENDTISKEEFYNEMARLQENLLNELKGQKVETESVDYFKEDEKDVTDDFDEYITYDNTTGEPLPKNTESSEDVVEEKESQVENNSKESKLAEEIINNWKEREGLIEKTEEEIRQEKAEEDAIIIASEIENGMNLLKLENPLDEEDLKYQEESEKEKEVVKDDCFYLSAEDNEKKAVNDDDEYVKMYNEEITGIYEVGDINLNKDIKNAVPYSKVDTEEEIRMKKEKEIELIYTLFGMEKKEVSKEKEIMKVLYVAGECQPFIATGGLADVAGSLPKAIAEKGGIDIRVILPLYGNIKQDYRDKFEYIGNFTVHLSWRQEYCGLFRYYADGVTYYFIDNERYFKRDKTYGYYDDGERFAYFSKAIVECLPLINFFPDIIHCNDWQSALVSTYIKTGNWSDFRYYKIKHIYTIHNVEYQGVYGMENLKDLFGIDPRFRTDMDYNGDINLTKAAILYSDKFTTVSESYCDNLKQPYCSRGLHHCIIRNEYKLSGIVNGLDYDFYNPETDKVIYKNYNVNTLQDKVMNKKVWQDELGLPVDGDTPMISIVSRLVAHKGLDLIIKMIENILQKDVQLVVVGTGDQKFVDYFKYLEGKYPTKVRAMTDKYSNELARKAYAASDIFLMPSKVEPCGLSQMIASRYGSIPVVREVGGLKDTIKDFGCVEGGNGYTFTNYNPSDLEYQVNRAIVDYADKEGWKKKMEVCMTQNFTWAKSADKYIELYNSIVR